MKTNVFEKVLLVIDIGGTTVKYGFWINQEIKYTGSFVTPDNWSEMLATLQSLPSQIDHPISGVAVSLPGSVDVEAGRIAGISAVPYLNNFDIREQLVNAFNLPVTLQNDANCAGLAEAWMGNAQNLNSVALLVIGTGIGGSLIHNGQLVTSHDHFLGEFGYSLLKGDETLSDLGSPVKMAKQYTELSHSTKPVTAPEVFELANSGDALAQQCIENMIYWLSVGVYNIITSLNPDRVLIGGGISCRKDVIIMIRQHVTALLNEHGASSISTEIESCKFSNKSNLIGAVAQYLSEYPEFSKV